MMEIGQRVWVNAPNAPECRTGTVEQHVNDGAFVRHDDGRVFGWGWGELDAMKEPSTRDRIVAWMHRHRGAITGVLAAGAILAFLFVAGSGLDDIGARRQARNEACAKACAPHAVESVQPQCMCNPALIVVPEEELKP